MSFLVIADAKHPLRNRIRELLPRIGGSTFRFLSTSAARTKLTPILLTALPSDNQLLFIPKTMTSMNPEFREIPYYGYKAWIAKSRSSLITIPEELGGLISSFLNPEEMTRLLPVSKGVKAFTQAPLEVAQRPYRVLWESLGGEKDMGPFQDFYQTLASPTGRRAYAEYERIMADPRLEDISLGFSLPPGEDYNWKLIWEGLPLPLIKRLLRRLAPAAAGYAFGSGNVEFVWQGPYLQSIRDAAFGLKVSPKRSIELRKFFRGPADLSRLVYNDNVDYVWGQWDLLDNKERETLRKLKSDVPGIIVGVLPPDRSFIMAAALGAIPSAGSMDKLQRRAAEGRTEEGEFIISNLFHILERKFPPEYVQRFLEVMINYLHWVPSDGELAFLPEEWANYIRALAAASK